MGDMAGQETTDYDSKLVSLEQALATIRPGSRIYLGTGCAAPRSLLAGLEAMQPGPPDLEFVSFVTTSALPMKTGASQTRYRHRTFFVGSDVRGLARKRPARLRADLARGGAGTPGERTAADRRGLASGFPARCPRLRQPRRVRGPRACGSERRAPRHRRGQPGDAAHSRRELRPSRPLRCARERRYARGGVPPSGDRRDRGARRALHRLDHRRRLDATDRARPRPQRGVALISGTVATSASTATSSPTASWSSSRPAW